MTQVENTPEIHDQKRRAITIKVLENIQDGSIEKRHRVIEQDSTFIKTNNNSNGQSEPIIGYAQEPLLPLSKACAPLVNIVENIVFYVQIALDKTPELPPDGLTIDESAAIRLYTMEWNESHHSLYSMLNRTLKNCDRKQLVPYLKYLKLFITALVKLPCVPPLTIWRGVTKDVSEQFPPETSVTWWSFVSCTTELTVLENNIYLGRTGNRTLFSIEAINCRTIRAHSVFTTEDEVILLPGTQLVVQSQLIPASDLHVIHLKQIVPNDILLEPPFEGANIYPKTKRELYRKKRFVIPMCLLTMICIAAIIVGSILGTRSHNNNGIVDTIIRWDNRNWAFLCDFNGSNISNVSTSAANCGPTCFNNILCTHFTWIDMNGGMCFLKDGNVSKEDAFYVNDPTQICGVEYFNDYIILNTTVQWDNNSQAFSCDFKGNALSNVLSTAANCSIKCSETRLCTHYMWYKYNGGTCLMKQGNVSEADAVSTNDPNMICGIIVST